MMRTLLNTIKTNFINNIEITLSKCSIVINIIILLISLSTSILPFFDNLKEYNIYFYIVIIIFQAISIWLSNKLSSVIEQSVFKGSKKQFFEKIKPYPKTISIQNARDELRFGLKIMIGVAVAVCFCLCIKFQNTNLFIAAVSILTITFIYADYIPHSLFYAKLYDSLFIDKSKSSNVLRGLARIYLEEYKLTKFDRKNKQYKKLSQYSRYHKYADIQDQCIKNVLFMKADSIRCPEIVYSAILMFINIFLTIPGFLDYTVNDLFKIKDVNVTFIGIMSVISINVIFSFIGFSNTFSYRDKCNSIKKIGECIIADDSKRHLEKYEEYRKNEGKKFEILRSRGVFVFCSTYISEGKKLDSIPLQYRMLFIHKLDANIPRFKITVLLLTVLGFALLNESNCPIHYYVIFICIGIFISLLFRIFLLPIIGKYRISNKCIELLRHKSS